MRISTSWQHAVRALAWAGAALLAGETAIAGAAPQSDAAGGRWIMQTRVDAPRAAWRQADGSIALVVDCDRSGARLVLSRHGAHGAGAGPIALVADSVRVDFPAEPTGAGLQARIALDSPIVDRMLVANRFTVQAGDDMLQTGAPGAALRPVVRYCRPAY